MEWEERCNGSHVVEILLEVEGNCSNKEGKETQLKEMGSGYYKEKVKIFEEWSYSGKGEELISLVIMESGSNVA